MKAGSKDHIKIKRLMRRLGLPLYASVGLVETLVQVTALSADDGTIGRYSDEDIALELGWTGDAHELVAALVECGWLDPHPTHRYCIHDWLDHAPDFLKDRLRKREQRGCAIDCPPVSGSSLTDTDSGGTRGGMSTTPQPNPTNSNQLKPNPTQPRRGALTSQSLGDTGQVLAWLAKHLKREPSEDEQVFAVAAAVAANEQGDDPPSLFVSIIKKNRRESVTNTHIDAAAGLLREHRSRAGPNGASTFGSDLAAKLKPTD